MNNPPTNWQTPRSRQYEPSNKANAHAMTQTKYIQQTTSSKHSGQPLPNHSNNQPTTCLASKQTEVITAHRNMQETKAHTTRYKEIAQINQATEALSKEHIGQQVEAHEWTQGNNTRATN